MLSALVALATSATLVSAHAGCSGEELHRCNPGGPLITHSGRSAKFGRRDDAPCSGYYYKPASDVAPNYPTTWQTAEIPSHDADAQNLLNDIKGKLATKFPNDVAHGKPNGDWTGVNYNGGQDPDCWWTYTGCTSPKSDTGLPADVTTVPEPGSYGLTFDDGPNCGNAPFYQYLKDNDHKATLFYIGSNVMNWPLQAIQGIEDGHEICAHTWSHQYMTALSTDEVFSELYYTRKIIKDILNVTVTCWRPPYGDVDNRVRFIANELGMQTIVWSDDTDDWSFAAGTPASKIDSNYQAIIDKQKNGQYTTHGPIVLAHELSDFTMNEAIKFLPQLKAAFSHLIPIATAFNNTQPYEEKDIVYPTFDQYISGHEDVVTTSLAPSASASSVSPSGAASTSSSAPSSSISVAPSQSSSPASSSSSAAPSAGNAGNAVRPSSAATGVAYVQNGLIGVIVAVVGLAVGL